MEWKHIQWKGGVLEHPTQQDGNSCGVIVVMMARAVMAAFPAVPKREMKEERKNMALRILRASATWRWASNDTLDSM
ncbi:hypothetical protein KUCAC02_026965 [Chaenocephalus aceratus]|nr:hypothetical protein KUCAC02_026965 [Chaenocephalus aceratus]